MTKIVIEGNEVLTLKEAAPYIEISKATLYRWMNNGRLPSVIYSGHTYIKVADAEKLKKYKEMKNVQS